MKAPKEKTILEIMPMGETFSNMWFACAECEENLVKFKYFRGTERDSYLFTLFTFNVDLNDERHYELCFHCPNCKKMFNFHMDNSFIYFLIEDLAFKFDE